MARRLVPLNHRPSKPRAIPKSRAKQNWKPPPDLPALDKDGLPYAFVAILRTTRSLYDSDDKRRAWLRDLAVAEANGHDLTTLVAFICALRGLRNWLASKERQTGWEIAEKRGKLAVTIKDPFEQARVKRSKRAHAAAWATTHEALVCLGFALKCGEKDHSLRLWRLVHRALLHNVFNRPRVLGELPKSKWASKPLPRAQSDDPLHNHSERVRQRLRDHRAKKGIADVHERAEQAFAIIQQRLFATVGINNPYKHPHPKKWRNP